VKSAPARYSAWAALGLACAAAPAFAQGRLLGEASATAAPSLLSWRFDQPLTQDSLVVRKAWQWSFPVSGSVRLGRVTIDAGAAAAVGRVGLEDGRTLELSGLTDLRIRGVARVVGDRLLVTTGVNAPVGATGLTGHEIDALGVLGAPALGFDTPTLGNGFGVTGGAVYAWQTAGWGLALGSSFESRAQYTPLEVQIAGAPAPADLRSGNAYRFSLGADRLIGRGRLSLLFAGEVFSESRLSLATGEGDQETRYTLGPQFSGLLVLQMGVRGFRSFTITLADRYRTKFTGFAGEKAAGSSGNVLEGALELTTGGTRGAGLYLRAEGLFDSGLEVDNTITTAAMTRGSLTAGAAILSGRLSILPFIKAQVGHLDTGPEAATATGIGAGVSLTVRP